MRVMMYVSVTVFSAFCFLSTEFKTPEELHAALHLVEKSRFRDLSALEHLNACADRLQYEVSSERLQSLIDVRSVRT